MKGRLLSVLFLLIFCHTMADAQPLTAVYPKPGQVLHDATIEFAWNTHPQAISYTLELNTINDFSSPILQTTIATNTFSYSLPQTGDYYWRVTAQLPEGGSASSPVYTFNFFSPNQIPGLVLWLDAADVVVDEQNRVSQWIDKSGMDNHVSQSTQSAQPIRALNVLNGHPAITFNGTSQYLDGGNILNIGTNSQAVFVVGKALKNTSSFIAKGIANSSPNRYAFLWESGKVTHFYFDNLSRNISVTKPIGNNELFTVIASRGNAKNYLYSNGTLLGSNNINALQNFTSTNNFLVGAYNNSSGTTPPLATYFHQGDIEEVIMYFSDITEIQRKTLERHLRKKYFPSQFIANVNLGMDREATNKFCPFTLDAGLQYNSYQWNTGENTSSISVNKSGIYSVTVTDSYGFTSIDSVRVQFPTTQLNTQEELVCSGESLDIYPLINNPELYNFEWSTGSSSHQITINETGSYWVKITDGEGCFAYSDTLNITVDNFANEFTLGEDLELCSGNILAAPENPDIISWQWGNGAVTPQIPITESGLYGITVTNTNGCIATDEVEVSIIGIAPETDFSADTVCLGNPTSFTDLSTLAEGSIEQWLWDFGDGNTANEQNPQHTYTLPGSYMVSLNTIASTTCQKGITKEVIVKAVPTAFFETSTACINVPYQLTDLSTAPEGLEIVAWDWSFGEGNTSTIQNPMYAFSNSGSANIELSITTNNSCSSQYSEIIDIVGEFPSPENFSMILPKSGSVISAGEILIQHNSTQNAIEYLIQVSDSEVFSNIILETNSSANDTSFISLPVGNYFARSKAINICLNETYTPAISFMVFSPTSISNLVLWLEADSTQLIDNLVSVWFDKSGNNNHATQTSSLNRPPLNNASIGGRKSISFDGINDFLNLTFNQPLLQPLSMIMVHNYLGTTNRFIIDGIVIDNRFALWNNNNQFEQFTNGGLFRYTKQTPYGFIITSGIFNSNNSKLLENNILKASGNNGATQLTGLTIGARYNNSSFFNGEIPEIIFYNKDLTNQELNILHSYLQYKYSPPVNLGADKRIAYGFCPVVLDAGEQFTSYLWNTGETTSSITVNTPGTYSVSVTDIFGFISSDDVNVSYPSRALNTQQGAICAGTSLELYPLTPNPELYTFEWSNGADTREINVTEAGSYWVKIIDSEGCFAYSDTLNITVDNFANEFTLGEDLELCSGNLLAAPENPDIVSWQWSNGAVTPQIPITESGLYGITVTNTNGCIATDEVEVTIIGIAPETDFTSDTVCLGNPTSFTDLSTLAEGSIEQWLWDFGDGNTATEQNPQHTYSLPGSYMVNLTAIASTTCQKSIAKEVIVKAVPTAFFETSTACINVPFQFIDLSTAPEGLEIVSWDWDFGDGNTSTIQNPMHTFSNSGTANIELNITTNNSCYSHYNEIIEVVGEFPSPENFSMILPKSGSIISEGIILIQHNSTQNAIEYLTQVSDNEDFSNIILETNSSANDTSYINLPIGNYFVRSKAINICLNETYTPAINFIVFSPSSISNLMLWLEADSVQLIDNLVSVWYDKSGNNNHAIQTSSLNRPPLKNVSLGGRKSISFDGINDFLNLSFNQALLQPLSMIMVHNYLGSTNRFIIDGIVTDSRFTLWNDNNFFEQFTNGGIIKYSKQAPYGFIITTGIFNGNNSKLFENNILQASGNNGTTQLTGLTIGSRFNNSSFFNGEIPEIILYNKDLTNQELNILHSYLHYKYSPPVNLGADKRIAYGFCPVVLDAGAQFTSYLWNTGETTQSITLNTAGTYSVSVTDIFGFVTSDEVEVRFPDMGLNTMDTTLCQGESMELAFSSAFTSDISLLWNTGETSPSIIVDQAGAYTLTLTDTLGCSTSLTAQIGIDDFENTATLGDDRPFCMGDTLWLQSPWQPWQLDYLWNDGSTGSGLVINQAGEYSLTATNPNGCTGTDTVSLSFQGYAPEVSFSAPPVCFGLPTSFTDGSTVAQSEIISRSWFFNDPQDPAGGASGSTAFYTYSQAGIFNASLEVSSAAGCSRSLSQAVQVYHLPEPAFGPPNVCANLNTSFSDKSIDMEGGIASWQWTATDTDGSTLGTSLLQNPEFSFPNPGTASLKLITSSLVGCSDSISRNINVRYSPEVDFSFTPACLGDMVSFTNLSQAPAWAGIQSTHWDFGDGDTTLLTNPSHLFQEAGIYPVTLTALAINGCQISLSKDVTVNYPPIVAFETPPICAASDYQFIDNTTAPLSEITSWNWNFSGLGSSTEQNPWFSFELPGQYNISLEAKSAAGCAGTITQPIEVMPRPVADFSFSPSFGVAPLNIGFQNLSQGAASFFWDFGDGSAPGTEAEPQHTYTQNGIYNAQLVSVSNMGCSDTLSRQIKVMFSTLDIAVGEIHYRTEQDYLICGVTLINLGSRIIESLQLTVSPQNLSPVMETWSGILPSGDLLYYEFNARFPISKAMPQYLCMDVAIPTIAADDIPENNHLCLALDDSFTVLPPYPNPANGNIQLSFILPADENVTIILIDSHGNLIDNIFDGPAQQGINTLYLNASSLNAGLYAFRILYRDQVVVKKMVVVN